MRWWFLKKIKIKCRLSNSINYYKYQAIIYNCLGYKVFDNLSNENGILIFDAPYYGVYKILIIKNKNVKFCTNIIVLENKDNNYYFYIPKIKNCLLSYFKSYGRVL